MISVECADAKLASGFMLLVPRDEFSFANVRELVLKKLERSETSSMNFFLEDGEDELIAVGDESEWGVLLNSQTQSVDRPVQLQFQVTDSPFEESVIYETHAVCPMCVCEGMQNLKWNPAVVFERKPSGNLCGSGMVYCRVLCESHMDRAFSYLVSSRASFFRRMLSYQQCVRTDVLPVRSTMLQILGFEPLFSYANLLLHVSVFHSGSLVSEEAIRKFLAPYIAQMQRKKNFVIRVSIGLSKNLADCHRRILGIQSLVSGCARTMLLDGTPERLCRIVSMPKSVLRQKGVHPYVRCFLKYGSETAFLDELRSVLQVFQEHNTEALMLDIGIDYPLPHLTDVLAFVRRNCDWIRACTFTFQRSVGYVMDQVANGRELKPLDALSLVRCIETASHGTISSSDFFPLGLGRLFFPIIARLGLGNFDIRAPEFSCFVTVLVNGTSLFSIPLSRIVDIDALSQKFVVLSSERKEGSLLSFFTAMRVKSLIQSCLRHKFPSNVVNSSTLDGAQLLIVRTHCDFACFEALNCSV